MLSTVNVVAACSKILSTVKKFASFTSVKFENSVTPDAPLYAIVTESVLASVVTLILVPPTSVSVSVFDSAATVVCPATATLLNAFWFVSPELALMSWKLNPPAPLVVST